MKRVIQCKYSCADCGIHRRVVSIPARTTEEIKRWMDDVCVVAIAKDHAIQSPTCRATAITELMIPIDTNDPNHRVGTA